MKLILAAAVAALTAGAAHAAVYRYEYQGRKIICDEWCEWSQKQGEWVQDGDDWIFEGSVNVEVYEGFTGYFVIDEALFPGRTLSNATLDIDYSGTVDYYPDVYEPARHSYNVTTPNGTYSGSWIYTGSLINVGIIEEGYSFFHSFIDYVAGASFEFDADGNIASWGASSAEGGSNDPFTSSSGDGYASGAYTLGAGTWTRTELSVPAPVPLPASGLMLLAGAGVLALFRRRCA